MKKFLAAVILLALSVSCQSSGPAGGTGTTGSGPTTVSGSGATGETATPYGLPKETPIGGDRPRPTVTSPPSNIPPTPRRSAQVEGVSLPEP